MKKYTVVSLGAGVQSSTMLLMAIHGEVTPLPDVAIFADTGAEPRSVYTWLDWLEKQVAEASIPILRVSRGSLLEDIREVAAGNSSRLASPPFFVRGEDKKAGMLRRHCTADYKINVVTKAIRERVVGLRPRQRFPINNVEVEQWMGISTDEALRMKPARQPWVTHRWPLIEKGMSREDCLRWMLDKGYQLPPKSACTFCPYHSNAAWRRLKEGDPADWEEVVEVDNLIRNGLPWIDGEVFLHRSLRPINEIDFSDEYDNEDAFNNECEGMCGV